MGTSLDIKEQKPMPISGYSNCFRQGNMVYIFLSEKDGIEEVPSEYRQFLNRNIFHGKNSSTSILQNKKGDLFTDSFTFYASKTNDESPDIISVMIIPKVFDLKPGLNYDDYLQLTKNLFREYSKRENKATYNSNKIDQATSPFDFVIGDYLDKINKVEAKLNSLQYGKQRELISSDKIQGDIDEVLWLQTGSNPFNIPQWVQTNKISEVLVLTYECLDFLLKKRIEPITTSSLLKKQVVDKINYLKHRISSNTYLPDPIKGKNFSQELNQLKLRFNRVRNHEDVKNNHGLFKSLQMLFYSEIHDQVIAVKTYNITKIWEDMMASYSPLKVVKTQVENDFYEKYPSKPDAVDSFNKVIDFKYKIFEGRHDDNDITKLWRDVIAQNKLNNLNEGSFFGELIYTEIIPIFPGKKSEWELKVEPITKKPIPITNDKPIATAIKLQYSIYSMFVDKFNKK